MTTNAHARLILELDLVADPVAGVLHDSRGDGQPFRGWMALTRTIELSLDAARRAGGGESGAGDERRTIEKGTPRR